MHEGRRSLYAGRQNPNSPNSIANSHSPLLPSYNYFISCSSFSTNKHSRLQTINKTLSSLYTPPLLQQYIIISHSKVYNVEFSPFKYSI